MHYAMIIPSWANPSDVGVHNVIKVHLLNGDNKPYCKNGGLNLSNYKPYCGDVPLASVCKTCYKNSIFDRETST